MPQYIITVGEDSTKSKAPEKYEEQVPSIITVSRDVLTSSRAIKAIKDQGGSVADEFDWGFIVNFADDAVSVSTIMENKTFETIEDGNGVVTTQKK
ncbi:hypothetical protein DSL72_004769 [Monilinia vaccinii-corymbosi]|uniref:Uncharacterized protein n=1 Tax=Monilinia vaccinii-corymbosi TaxID=61207 RepID=A0A8A3PA06_9HELO|nr:hypothetical protein DSL72_004769 [Monilinia vaccinii-corymbosi]